MSVFFAKKIAFLCPKNCFVRAVLGFLVLFSVFVRQRLLLMKTYILQTVSGIQPPDCSKLAKNPKNGDITIFWHDIIIHFFSDFFFCSYVKFSYWSKFYVNIITGSGIMTIFFHKGLTRNPEMRNTPTWVLPNIWKLGRVMDTTFDTNFSNRILNNAAKCQGYSFYPFWVIKGKPTGQ